MDIDLTKRKSFQKGMYVYIHVGEEEVAGYIKSIDTTSDNDKGIKVTLTNGQRGRVCYVPTVNEIKKDSFKFYNLFFHQKELFSIYDNASKSFMVLPILNKVTNRTENTIFIFSDKSEATTGFESLKLDNKKYRVINIKNKNQILDSYKNIDYSIIRINLNRKLTKELFVEYEKRFKSF